MKLKNLLIIIISSILFFFNSSPVLASWFWKEKKIEVKKQVWDFRDQVFVDDLSLESDHAYSPQENNNQIRFKIIVTNTGEANLKKIKIKDILPTDFVYYHSGDLKNENSELTAEIEDLKKGDFQELEYIARVVSREDLLSLNDHSCSFNTVQAQIEGKNEVYEDKARVCLRPRQDLGFRYFPETGPAENILILSTSAILALFAGALLKKS